MSLFPAYSSSATNSSVVKTEDKSAIKTSGDNKDWLSLSSFDDKKVIELNKEIIVDNKRSDDRHKHSSRHSKRSSKSDERSKSRSSDKRHERHDSPPKTSSQSLSQFLSNKTFIEETGLSPQNAYRIDTKRDKNNLAFNSLYYKNVAIYEKNKTINISKRKRDPKDDSAKSRKNKKMRYFSHENRVLLKKGLQEMTDLSKPEMRPMREPLEFIAINANQPFSQLLSATTQSTNNPLGVYDAKTALWSEGKGSLDEIPLPETTITFQSMKDKSLKNEPMIGVNRCPTREQYIYDKTQEMNAYLRDNETDVEKWLQLIAFQDKCVETTDSDKDKIDGKTFDVFIAEKKLAICEKALTFNPKSIDLLLCRLEIVSNIWESDKVFKEWKRLVFLYPNSMQMWRKYLLFSHQNITQFKASKTLKIYEKCVQMLSKMLEKTFISHTPPEDLEIQLLSILSSYSRFLLSIGQTERAVSTFQALIEFNLFTPSLLTLDMSVEDWKTLFEPFWDSSCPRFGQKGAIGWSQVMLKKNMTNTTEEMDSQIQSLMDSEENKIIAVLAKREPLVGLK
ncbi:unnamed protein product [Oppiella nova]|uniref:Protein NRDE2 homolog n=1 Tax=Oppiella nova TaxID=334625 RepID=A0A7R9LNC3_9ACAR|nr:unnamed protein product [Oppiella nova]CAG2165334.1 unnamed protein product [Oppiella nova]